MTRDWRAVSVGALRLASGVSFLVNPVKANRMWGDRSEPDTTTRLLLRSMGYRDALVGGLLLSAGLRGRPSAGWFLASAGADTADLVGGLAVHGEMDAMQKAKGLGGAVLGIGVGLWGAWRAQSRKVG